MRSTSLKTILVPDLILVPVGPAHPGLLVQFTPEEYERHMRGVDREAAEVLSASLTERGEGHSPERRLERPDDSISAFLPRSVSDPLGSDICRCSRLWPLSPEALERARRWEEGLRR